MADLSKGPTPPILGEKKKIDRDEKTAGQTKQHEH